MDFKEIEIKWQKWWEEHPELYRADDDVGVDPRIDPKGQTQGSARTKKPKKYVLVEFPYPSGSGLHVGHTFAFTGSDVYARYFRMKGYNVLFPMGWDAFGLPTENYAIKMKRKPAEVTKENTDMYREQMKKLAFSFDWSREINTADPDYYKWTQWIFIQLFKKGLAYKKEMPINWCPSCKIGLANEEVVDGRCERCGSEVSRRNISQWVVKITDYADRLVEGLKDTDFIEKVKAAQINWIGKSEGAKIRFKIKDSSESLEVFTTRPDTLSGATFMVISPEHELIKSLKPKAENWEEINGYLKQARNKSEMERTELNKDKTGVFLGMYAINPFNNKEIPIWISDFVLASYGTGAIMSVPAHDDRDKEFAQKYNLPIINVYDENEKVINSKLWNGLNKNEAIKKAIEWIKEKGIGEKSALYHLRDWIFSRQHYWGEPIPMINCPKDGWVPVPEADLPLELPEVDAYEPTDDGLSPLSRISDFVNCTCPKCGGEAKRETDTMPNWAGSDWYFLRYIDPNNNSKIAEIDILKKWMPVDVYVGGDEHNTLHLLYSRFIYQFLWDLGMVPKEVPEPYFHRMSHGVILGSDNNRMSKSKGNVIVPETVADRYGVDVVRMYLMFMGPFEGTMAWNEKTLMGVKRFLDRFEKFIISQLNNDTTSNINNKVLINKLIKGVGDDIENFGFNTAIAKLMKTTNELKEAGKEEIKILIKLIAPLAPYTSEELWSKFGEGSVHTARWPEPEEKYLIEDKIMVAVAVNGKTRSQIEVNKDELNDEKAVLDRAKSLEKIKEWIGGKTIVKEIYVPGRMVNLVVK